MNPYEGGIGYGDDGPHSDVSNTTFAMEALRETRSAMDGQDVAAANDLNWDAALAFLQRCQNLPKYNAQPWVTGDAEERRRLHLHAARRRQPRRGRHGRQESAPLLRQHELLGPAQLHLRRSDQGRSAGHRRLRLARHGIIRVEENPGLGASGLFYYYHTMSKALSTYGADQLPLAGGKSANWRHDLALKLIDLQASEGSWVNAKSGRWWEKDPVLVTSYAVRTLEMMHAGV